MATVLLMIVMTLAVKILGIVALERRQAERRQRALVEVANTMERITAHPFLDVTPELARRTTLSETAQAALPDSELSVDISDAKVGDSRIAKRIAIRLRWRGRSGEWEAPVRLTSWIEARRARS
jgi:hypothetical protein